MKQKPLKKGEKFRYEDNSTWEVLRVSVCSATVKCLSAVSVGIVAAELLNAKTGQTGVVEYHPKYQRKSRPGAIDHISPFSFVERING